MNYEEIVEHIYEIPKFTKKNDLENTRVLYHKLGQPGIGRKIIHIAGTNGKGSVSSYLSNILKEAGYVVGMFTSPHLVEINERFKINNMSVSNQDFIESFEKVKKTIDEMMKEGYAHPTFFEVLFIMAMEIFEKKNTEYIILETGLGGRLDASNIIPHPLVTVITSIGLDHIEYLGNTIEEIAGEKAGIIKRGVPLVCDGTEKIAEEVIYKKAIEAKAPFYKIDSEDIEVSLTNHKQVDFYLKYGYYKYVKFSLKTIARYQALNAALAIKTIEIIKKDKEIESHTVKAALEKTYWPGRMEEVLDRVILDGAHNITGIRKFIESICIFENEKKIFLLFSAVKEKNYEKMIKELCENLPFEKVFITELKDQRAIPLETLTSVFEKYTDKEVKGYYEIDTAFEKALKVRANEGILVCTGSLYLVGEIIKLIRRKKDD